MAAHGLKNVFLTNFGASAASGASNALLSSYSDEDADPTKCHICFDSWESEGTHRAASLKCGHIFGHSCVEKWLRRNALCPICKRKSRVSDLRPHFLSLPKTAENELSLLAELQQAREELTRAKSELAYLKSSNASSIPLNPPKADPEDLPNPHLNHKSKNVRSFEIFSRIDGLADADCLEYCDPLNACIIAGASPLNSMMSGISLVYPTYHKMAMPPSSHPSVYGLTIIRKWETDQLNVSYVPLFSHPITCMTFSPFEPNVFLVASSNGSLRIIRLVFQEWSENSHSTSYEALSANILVELLIDDGNYEVSSICWDVTCPSIVYASTGSCVRAFDIGTGKVTYELDIGQYAPIRAGREERIFSIISLPENLDSESPRLLIGSSWGMYHVLMDENSKSEPWDMSGAIIDLSQNVDWFCDSSSNHDYLLKNPDFLYWNFLKPALKTGNRFEAQFETNLEHSPADNFLFICGYQTIEHQKYFTFDLRLNARSDVPAPMCPLILESYSSKARSSITRSMRQNHANGFSIGSACFIQDRNQFYILALAPSSEIMFIQPKPLLHLSSDQTVQNHITSLMSRSSLQMLSSCKSWSLLPNNSSQFPGNPLFVGISSSTLFFIASQ